MTDDSTRMAAGTFAARVTPPGPGALATLEIHGPNAVSVAAELFHPAASIPKFGEERRHYYGRFGYGVVDDVVLAVLDSLPVESGRIAPGSPTIQVHCHGGPAMVQALLSQIESRGVHVVDWHELLARRGVHWTRIEAAVALGRVTAWRAAAILLDQWQGSLEREFEKIESHGTSEIVSLLKWWEWGRHLVEGWRIMLVGPPNVGKSTLLNALVGFERVIVHETPGTTRDVIEVETALDGWPAVLCDAAGLRESVDPIEQAGVAKAIEWSRSADLRILVCDLSVADESLASLRSAVDPHLVVGNKADLPTRWSKTAAADLDLVVSATTLQGVDLLIDAIVQRIVPQVPTVGQAIPFTARQREWLERRMS